MTHRADRQEHVFFRTIAGMPADFAGLVHLFGDDCPNHTALIVKRLYEYLICPLIESLNGLPLHIGFTCEAKRAMQCRFASSRPMILPASAMRWMTWKGRSSILGEESARRRWIAKVIDDRGILVLVCNSTII